MAITLLDEAGHDALDHTGLTGVGGGGGGGGANPYVGTQQCLQFGSQSLTAALAADRVYIVRFAPTEDITVASAAWHCATSAGNLGFAIYNEALDTRLGTTGAFASPGTGSRTQALGVSVALTAGSVYYLAMVTDSTTLRIPTITNSFIFGSGWNLYGHQSSAAGGTATPPSSITPSAWEGAVTMPVFFFTP